MPRRTVRPRTPTIVTVIPYSGITTSSPTLRLRTSTTRPPSKGSPRAGRTAAGSAARQFVAGPQLQCGEGPLELSRPGGGGGGFGAGASGWSRFVDSGRRARPLSRPGRVLSSPTHRRAAPDCLRHTTPKTISRVRTAEASICVVAEGSCNKNPRAPLTAAVTTGKDKRPGIRRAPKRRVGLRRASPEYRRVPAA
jgi:hypothetical protein